MAILDFQQPDRVIMLEGTPTRGRFEFRPLEPGYGITIGNSLRRILLSSLEGFAISWIQIKDVDHEFSTIEGVIEDVTQIILNLKQVRFRCLDKDRDVEQETVTVSIGGQEEFKAGFMNNFLTNFEVLNSDLVVCRMSPSVRLEITLNVCKGRGYVPSEENIPVDNHFGIISIDSIHTPIRNVMYKVENFRVEQKTDYEKLIFEIETDGSIAPKDALTEAATILIHHFQLFSDERIAKPDVEIEDIEEFDEEAQKMRKLLKSKLLDLGLSVRALNCLKAAEVDTIGELVKFSKSDLLKFRNFGKKSLTEIEDVIANMGLSFSMDVAKYKLDKD